MCQDLGHLLRAVGENPTESEIGVGPPVLSCPSLRHTETYP